MFRESFLSKLQLLLRGTVAAPPERFGETLADEHIRGGCSGCGEGCSAIQGGLLGHLRASCCCAATAAPAQPSRSPACSFMLLPALPAAAAGGAFVGPDNKPVIVSEHLPNAHMRLFGGAQYHRAMAEFRAGARRWLAG